MSVCIRRGADYVLGLEGKDEFLKQADMLKDYFGYTNVEFRKADMSTVRSDALGQFDVVLLMGIIYYLENPIDTNCRIAMIASKEKERNFQDLEDKLFALSSRLGRIPLEEYLPIEKDFK